MPAIGSLLLLTATGCASSDPQSHYRNPLFVHLEVEPLATSPGEPPGAFWTNALEAAAKDDAFTGLLETLYGVEVSLRVVTATDSDALLVEAPPEGIPLALRVRDGEVEAEPGEDGRVVLSRSLEFRAESIGLIRMRSGGAEEDPFAGLDAWEQPLRLAIEDLVWRRLKGWRVVGGRSDLDTRIAAYATKFRWTRD